MAGAEGATFRELVARNRRFVLTTHVNPDGDGIGSEIALAALIERARRGDAEVRIVNNDPVPESLGYLDPSKRVERYDPIEHGPLIGSSEVVIGLDNSDPSRFGELFDAVRSSAACTVCIDHHPNPDPFWSTLMVDEGASCTGEIVLGLYRALELSPGVLEATALYTALVSDTGRFRFANTDASSFEMAAELVRLGAEPVRIFTQLEERMSDSFLRLLGEVIADAEFRAGGRLVLLRAPAELVARQTSTNVDLSDIINLALRSTNSRVAALFRELGPERTKVSLRSKGTLDVNKLARNHGGGGHRNASGVLFPLAMDRAIERLLPDLEALVG